MKPLAQLERFDYGQPVPQGDGLWWRVMGSSVRGGLARYEYKGILILYTGIQIG